MPATRAVERMIRASFDVFGLEVRRKRNWSVPSAPEIPEHLLAECQVVPNRERLLDVLPKGGTVAEIGVAYGDFSEQILRLTEPELLVLVDLWDGDRYGAGFGRVNERFADEIAAGKVHIERGLSVEVMKRLQPRFFDWIYLDTSHDYETTKAELRLASELVAPGGYIAGHDFCIGNPELSLPYGVVPAVSEFCIERHFNLTHIALAADGYFSFCLQQPAGITDGTARQP